MNMEHSNKAQAIIVALAGLFAFVTIVIADDTTSSVTVSNATPSISTVNFNGGSAITLTEATYTYASATITVSDTNGCSTINAVEARAFVASTSPVAVGNACAANDNNCYITASSSIAAPTLGGCYATTTGNTCTGGLDTSVQYDCGLKFWYIAEGTDSAAPVWASSIWSISATTSDGSATSTATNSTQVVEINSLSALDVTATLPYGTLSVGTNTGSTNSTSTVTTTGNIAIDTPLSGTDMTGARTIDVSRQIYHNAAFTYPSGTARLTTTTTPTLELLNNNNPSSTTTNSIATSSASWGIQIDTGQANGAYTGTNTFAATAD